MKLILSTGFVHQHPSHGPVFIRHEVCYYLLFKVVLPLNTQGTKLTCSPKSVDLTLRLLFNFIVVLAYR